MDGFQCFLDPFRFCQNTLMACLHQFKQFFLWLGLHCLPLQCYCFYRMNAPVYRCAIAYKIKDGLLPMHPSGVTFDKLLLWHVCINFKQFFPSPGLHWLSLKCSCFFRVNSPVLRHAITLSSRWIFSNASLQILFLQILLLAILHQF